MEKDSSNIDWNRTTEVGGTVNRYRNTKLMSITSQDDWRDRNWLCGDEFVVLRLKVLNEALYGGRGGGGKVLRPWAQTPALSYTLSWTELNWADNFIKSR